MAKDKGLTAAELQELQELEELEELEALEAAGKLESKAPVEKGFGASALDALGYLGRGARTALNAPLSDETSLSDVADQLAHLHPENTEKPAPSGKELLSNIKLPVLGVNPDFKGPKPPESVSALNALAGDNPTAQKIAGGATEVVTDPTTYLPFEKLFNLAGMGVSKGAGLLDELLSKTANISSEAAPKILTKSFGASKPALKKLDPNAVDFLMENELIRPFDTVEDIASRVGEMGGKAGEDILKSARLADEAGIGIQKADLIKQLQNEANALKRTGAQGDQVRKIESIINDLSMADETLAVSDVELGKRALQTESEAAFGETLKKEGAKGAQRIYKEASEGAIEQLPDPMALEAFKEAKKVSGILDPVQKAADDAVRSQQANRSLFSGIKNSINDRVLSTVGVTAYKIPRTIEGIQQAIPNLMQSNPMLAQTLSDIVALPRTKAIRALGPIMNQMGDEFEDAEYPSLFEGKLHDPQDIADYSEKLKDELSPIERAKAQSALNKDGSVNLPPPEPKPMPAQETPIRKPITLEDMSANVKQRQY